MTVSIIFVHSIFQYKNHEKTITTTVVGECMQVMQHKPWGGVDPIQMAMTRRDGLAIGPKCLNFESTFGHIYVYSANTKELFYIFII